MPGAQALAAAQQASTLAAYAERVQGAAQTQARAQVDQALAAALAPEDQAALLVALVRRREPVTETYARAVLMARASQGDLAALDGLLDLYSGRNPYSQSVLWPYGEEYRHEGDAGSESDAERNARLLSWLQAPYPRVREYALRCLSAQLDSWITRPQAISPFIQSLADPSEAVRLAAVQQLASMRSIGRDARQAVREAGLALCTGSADPATRHSALRALADNGYADGGSRDEKMLEALLGLLADPAPAVRARALGLLWNYSDQIERPAMRAAVLARLTDQGESIWQRVSAAQMLVRIAGRGDRDVLVGIARLGDLALTQDLEDDERWSLEEARAELYGDVRVRDGMLALLDQHSADREAHVVALGFLAHAMSQGDHAPLARAVALAAAPDAAAHTRADAQALLQGICAPGTPGRRALERILEEQPDLRESLPWVR